MTLHERRRSHAMRRHAIVAGALSLATLVPASLASQTPTVSRVRIDYLEQPTGRPREVVGTLQVLTSDSIVVATVPNDRSVVIPTVAISMLAVSEGQHRHIGRGASIGFLTGGAVGFAAGALLCTSGECTRWDSNEDIRGTYIVVAGCLGAVGGAALGALIGIPLHEHWRAVLPTQTGAASARGRRRVIAPLIAPMVGTTTPMTGSRAVGVRLGLTSEW